MTGLQSVLDLAYDEKLRIAGDRLRSIPRGIRPGMEAGDVVAEATVKLLEAQKRSSPQVSNPKAYFAVVCHNLLVDNGKSAANQRFLLGRKDDAATTADQQRPDNEAPEPDQPWEKVQETFAKELRKTLDRLDEPMSIGQGKRDLFAVLLLLLRHKAARATDKQLRDEDQARRRDEAEEGLDRIEAVVRWHPPEHDRRVQAKTPNNGAIWRRLRELVADDQTPHTAASFAALLGPAVSGTYWYKLTSLARQEAKDALGADWADTLGRCF